LVVDDELNILPISSHARSIVALPAKDEHSETPSQKELKALKLSLAEHPPAGLLVNLAKTLDQAKAILTFIDAIGEKTLRSTVALTAARGRGKSAALGMSIARSWWSLPNKAVCIT
jgi:N-acetyltransferase 10